MLEGDELDGGGIERLGEGFLTTGSWVLNVELWRFGWERGLMQDGALDDVRVPRERLDLVFDR